MSTSLTLSVSVSQSLALALSLSHALSISLSVERPQSSCHIEGCASAAVAAAAASILYLDQCRWINVTVQLCSDSTAMGFAEKQAEACWGSKNSVRCTLSVDALHGAFSLSLSSCQSLALCLSASRSLHAASRSLSISVCPLMSSCHSDQRVSGL